MAWTVPMTFTAGTVLTAAQLNTHLRDNLNATAPAVATTAGRLIVTTGLNAIAERVVTRGSEGAAESTASTSYVDLTTVGPSVTVTSGTNVLVMTTATVQNSSADAACYMTWEISGASSFAASDTWALIQRPSAAGVPIRHSVCHLFPVTAGSNTFTAKYRASAGTATFTNRQINIIAL